MRKENTCTKKTATNRIVVKFILGEEKPSRRAQWLKFLHPLRGTKYFSKLNDSNGDFKEFKINIAIL